ncbi:MAG: hypothetical protein PHG19_05810 [Anaerotignum sp.]|nr:hypothetical protein [Anaerotignum sp.]
MRFYEGGNTRARKQDLGRRPLTAQDRADGEAGFCVAKVSDQTCLLFEKSKSKNFYTKPHIYAVLRGWEYKGKKARPTIKGQGAMAKKCHLSEGQICVAKC